MFKILWALSPAKFFLTLSVITLFIISSCNKSSILGLEVQPPNDLIGAEYQDTLTLLTQTIQEDTLKTSGIASVMIGKYVDPIFGETSSSLYTQLRMFANAPTFGNTPVCDSVVLSLVYAGSYGKKIRTEQILSVYELDAAMDINASYYSKSEIATNPTDLANFKFIPKPTDSVVIDTNKYKSAPQLRVKLPAALGQKILDKQNTSDLATNDNFMQFFKGLKITTENTTGQAASEGNLLQFRTDYSSMAIYFNYKNDSNKVVHSVYYLSLANVARFMKFNHDFSKAIPDVQNQVLQTQPPLTNDVCYAQGAAGLKTKIKIPNLVSWGKKDFIGINRAELIVTAISSIKDTFAIPGSMVLYGIGNDGTSSYFLPDAYDGTDYFGGSVKVDSTVTPNITTYKFTITRYIQQVISGRLLNNGLHLVVSNGSSNPYRIVFGGGTPTLTGGGDNKYKMKLNVTYTKLN